MSYGDTWPAPNPHRLHIESVIDWHTGEARVVHYLMRGNRALYSRSSFTTITQLWADSR